MAVVSLSGMTLHVVLLVGTCFTAVLGQHVQLSLGVETEQYTVPCNTYKYFQVDATEPCKDLKIQVNHAEGEPDLYVSRGPEKLPTFRSLAWSSYEWGSESLTISSWDPEYVLGTYYIGVLAYCGSDVSTGNIPAKFTMLAEHVTSTHPHDEVQENGQIAGNIAAEGYKYYRFCVPSTCANIDVGLASCIDPATCPTTYSYPELLVSRSIQQPTINSHAWKLATIDVRSVTLNHDDPDFYPGHYFVGVYGWCTPDDLCSDMSTCGPCSYADNTEFILSLTVTNVTENCTPKAPLELCSTDGTTSMASSFKVLLLSMSLGWIINAL
ncbi:uncharacterized protein LOC100893574 [Strongylocentrotus purpuratus]|uniref:Uncharacterized protein n=1 Tax=Strongylocentrotus purpuratus TaxID=7668 RepID=A0A7M7GJ87_STRPU|nr:uncharacterized protein LOC100893574 [Strongylocentrotus purpuratus]|eukprot:XP_011665777.1 PREDICTED: uncharacterized protein LOC100888563 [Strongylocentrotus purpuratus]